MAELTPRNNTRLIGHEDAEALLLEGLSSGKLAHGWIIAGPRGIGKATLAYRFARTLLAGEQDISEDHPVFHRVVANSHADLLVVEQLWDEKKEENVREISVKQAREIPQFMSLTPGEGQWRIVIVDAADALNTSSANAILKILEEPPPQAILLLVSHNPGRLLPTIRSRCRMLKLRPLDSKQFAAAMRHIAPQIGSEEYNALGQLSGYAPGLAVEMHGQGATEIYGQMVELLATLPNLNTLQLHAFADQLASGQVHSNWQLFTRLCLSLLERVSLKATGTGVTTLSDGEAELLNKLANMYSADVWATKWQQCADQFLLAERLHLDYKQLIITFFHSIASRDGFQIGNAA